MKRVVLGWLAVVLAVVADPGEARALITGGKGNMPINDPGWPRGAATIFNHPGRVAWWEGPPFGGGEWHSECRGDAKALSAVLGEFARLDAKTRQVVVHDGIGHSFWLAPNREPEKLAEARIDWSFTVWQPASWERLRKLPADLNPTDPADAGPPAQIDVFTGNLRWTDVTVPEGIEVIDQRLEAHGFTAADGVVLEGRVTDLATEQPITARVRLERVEPRPRGGYDYPALRQAQADAQGRWVLKNVSADWVRVVIEADGYAPRVVAHDRFDDQPRWQSYESTLSRPGAVSGRVTDDGGKPLAGVEVRLQSVVDQAGRRYDAPGDFTATTGADGRFRVEPVPAGGRAAVWVAKAGYCWPGLGPEVPVPSDAVALQMVRSARVRVTVDFTGKDRPEGYIVEIAPEGGSAVGTYGGSGNIDAANQMTFENVPPGRYVFRGQPNPSSADQRTEPVTVELKGGEAAEVTLRAK